jgi:hypothetical protein
MKKKVIKLNENQIEKLVNKIIIAEANGSITDQLDDVIEAVRVTQREYEEFADSITGIGYMDEIDGIAKDINKLEGKLMDVKSKTHEMRRKRESDAKQGELKERKKLHNNRKRDAGESGRNYSY